MIPISRGVKIKYENIRATQSYNSCYFDIDGQFLQTLIEPQDGILDYQGEITDFPENAAYIGFSAYVDKDAKIRCQFFAQTQQIVKQVINVGQGLKSTIVGIENPYYTIGYDVEDESPVTSTGKFSYSTAYTRTGFIEINDTTKRIELIKPQATSSYRPWWYDEFKRPLEPLSTDILPAQSLGTADAIINKVDIPTKAKYLVSSGGKSASGKEVRVYPYTDSINKSVLNTNEENLFKISVPYWEWHTNFNGKYTFGVTYMKVEGVRKIHLVTTSIADYPVLYAYNSKKEVIEKYTTSNKGLSNKNRKMVEYDILIDPNDNVSYITFGCYIDADSQQTLDKCSIDLYFTLPEWHRQEYGYISGNNNYERAWSESKCVPYFVKKRSIEYSNPSDSEFNLCIALNTDTHGFTIPIFKRIYNWCSTNEWVKNGIAAYLTLGDANIVTTRVNKAHWVKEWEGIWKTIDAYAGKRVIQLITIGNHDVNQDSNTTPDLYAKKQDKYDVIIKPMLARYSENHLSLDDDNSFAEYAKLPIVTPNEDSAPTYYSVDFQSYKIKLIIIDTYDFEDSLLASDFNTKVSAAISMKQLDFIQQQLEDAIAKNYSVALCLHNIYNNSWCKDNSLQVMKDFASAFRNKTSHSSVLKNPLEVTSDLKTYTYDFSSSNGKIFFLQGHGHYFSKFYMPEGFGEKQVDAIMAIATEGQATRLPRTNDMDAFDIFIYHPEDGFRFVRYGDANGMSDVDNNDGADNLGFHFVDNPMKVE